MNLPFLSREDLVIGIDIGSHAIKVCQLQRTDKAYAVVNLGSATLPEGAVDDGTLSDPEVVGGIISELFKNLKIKKKKVGFSISGYSVIVKKVNLAVMSEEELEEHIQSEAEQYIPFDIDDVYLDFQDLKTNEDDDDRTDVMLVAAKKEIVDDYLEMLENLNLRPVIVDVDGFALENTYEYNYPKEENVALVDIGGGTTDITIFADGIIRHTAVVPFGGNIITKDIQDGCKIMENQAEKLKVKFGSALASENKDEEIVSIPGLRGRNPKEITLKNLASIIQARVEEIVEHVFYEIQNSGYEKKLIGGIVLTGGGAQLKHIAQIFEFLTGMDTRIGLPNEHLASNVPEELSSPLFATGIGLVIKGLQNADRQQEPQNHVKGHSNDEKKGSFFDTILKKGRQFFEDDVD